MYKIQGHVFHTNLFYEYIFVIHRTFSEASFS